MKTVIVATDFSKEAENAIEYAGAASKQLDARIILFNSFSLPTHAANTLLSAVSVQQLVDHNNANLKERAAELSGQYDIEVGYESGLMLPVNEELDVLITKYDADLVVMGMAAKTMAQDLFGNTTTAAIMRLKVPILAIPLGVTYQSIKRMLFACDVLRGVHKKILDQVKALASVLGAEVEIFHVRDKLNSLKEQGKGDIARRSIEEGLEGIMLQYKDIESEVVIEEIEKEANQYKADLLIMIPHKYGFWDSLIHRSKTRIMASNSEIPLLSISI